MSADDALVAWLDKNFFRETDCQEEASRTVWSSHFAPEDDPGPRVIVDIVRQQKEDTDLDAHGYPVHPTGWSVWIGNAPRGRDFLVTSIGAPLTAARIVGLIRGLGCHIADRS